VLAWVARRPRAVVSHIADMKLPLAVLLALRDEV